MPVIDRPETQYALSGELSIAYQVFGHGERDLLYVPGMISHLELSWDDERLRSFLTELGQHFRVIMLDGKAIKYAARRLKALWGVPGSLIAARALASWD